MEEDIFRSPQSSISNANFQPSLNAKFRKRVVGKPLQFDKNKIAKLNKILVFANRRNDSSDSTYKIPSISKPIKTQGLRTNRSSKNLKNSSKGGNTSRNRHTNVNLSYNGMPKLRENYISSNSRLNMQNMPNDMYEYSGLNNTIDLPNSLSKSQLISPRSDSKETIFKLQRKITELKELLADRESQLEWIKKTLKYAEVSELKQENDMLYNECKRLRRYVNILVNRSSDIETVSENEMINEVEENITDPILKQKFTSK